MYFSYFVKNSSTVAARWELQLQGKIMQFTLVQNNGSRTWRFKTANPYHNSVENGTAVCLKQKERGSNFTSDANTGDIYILTLKNSTKEFLQWRNLKRMEQEGERKTNQDKFMFLLRSKITPFSERNNSEKFGFGKNKGQQLQLYSLPQIAAATKNFSINKKLGQGGFGEVYKMDPTKSKLLGWNRRFSIIEGVAQGLLYLLGTYFGVLLLEIVSGKNNAVFSHLSGPLSLIEHVNMGFVEERY
ncbi:unnamed protein product [Camellia sinensis]